MALLVVADRTEDRIDVRDDAALDARADAPDVDSAGRPVRHCLATGMRREKAALLRFVVDPSGTVVPDLKERLPGRGLWLSAERDVVQKAITKRLFAKAARAAVTVPVDLLVQVERLLVRGCQERLGLARRAGHAVSGYEKSLAQVEKGKASLVVIAGDAGANVRESGLGEILHSALTADELGGVFDRPRAVYIALGRGPLMEKIRIDLMRLAAIRRVAPDDDASRHGKSSGRRERGKRAERMRAHG